MVSQNNFIKIHAYSSEDAVQSHPIFSRILLHSNEELNQLLGSTIRERQTIHQWPLSCVQRLCLEDGTRLIYKSQLPPTVEAQFYRAASSPLLPGYQLLNKLGDCETMVIEWVQAPLLRDTIKSPEELLEHGRELIAQIGAIEGTLPFYLDISTAEVWSILVETTIRHLRNLILNRRFRLIDVDRCERLYSWARCSEVIDTITSRPQVIHGDLKADQIFVVEDAYHVIDWQRPVVAPSEIDLVSLLVEEGMDPLQYIQADTVKLFWFLRLHWAVEAQINLLPDFRGQLFDQWASEAINQICTISR